MAERKRSSLNFATWAKIIAIPFLYAIVIKLKIYAYRLTHNYIGSVCNIGNRISLSFSSIFFVSKPADEMYAQPFKQSNPLVDNMTRSSDIYGSSKQS